MSQLMHAQFQPTEIVELLQHVEWCPLHEPTEAAHEHCAVLTYHAAYATNPPKVLYCMKLALNIREFRRSQLLRVIAMLFLLHSGVDMLFPQLCNEEESFGGSFSSTWLVAANNGEVEKAFAVDGSCEFPDDQRSDPQHRGEDCFCCCTHVMPSPVFASPDNAELVISRSPVARIFIPAAPSDNPYHPPRLA
jgi:hypothetical protein